MNDAWSIGRGTPKIASKDTGLMIRRLPKIGVPQNHPELDLFSIESHDCGAPHDLDNHHLAGCEACFFSHPN